MGNDYAAFKRLQRERVLRYQEANFTPRNRKQRGFWALYSEIIGVCLWSVALMLVFCLAIMAYGGFKR